MNINMNVDDYNFYLRVCAMIFNKDKTKILINGMKDRDFYILPGGRVKFGEESSYAIDREIQEEIGWKLEYNFKFFAENFVDTEDRKAHQICICYEAVYDGKNEDKINENEGDFNTYYWIDVSNLCNYNIKPKITMNMLNSNNIRFVSYED